MPAWIRLFLGSLCIGIVSVLGTNQVYSTPVNQPLNKNKKEYLLKPRIRTEAGGDTQAKGLDVTQLQAFLRVGLFIPRADFLRLPAVTYAQDAHLISADRDLVYSSDIIENEGDSLGIYRTGKAYYDPKTKKLLGYMAFRAAEAQILQKQHTRKKNNIVLQIKHNVEPVDQTMRIAPIVYPPILDMHYVKPALFYQPLDGVILDTWEPNTTLIGDNACVVLSVGKKDGVSVGNLLSIYRAKDLLDADLNQKNKNKKAKDRPEIRVGQVLVYQVDEKLSLGLITDVYEKIILFDKVRGEIQPDSDQADFQKACASRNN